MFNEGKGPKGKYSGKAGKNPHRNPQPGYGGYHAAPRKGCGSKKFVPGVFVLLVLIGIATITITVKLIS